MKKFCFPVYLTEMKALWLNPPLPIAEPCDHGIGRVVLECRDFAPGDLLLVVGESGAKKTVEVHGYIPRSKADQLLFATPDDRFMKEVDRYFGAFPSKAFL